MLKGGPSYTFANSVASHSFHATLSSGPPRYPLKAFFPHRHKIGLLMGAKAETALYCPGFLKAHIKAPCPPMLNKQEEGYFKDYIQIYLCKKICHCFSHL